MQPADAQEFRSLLTATFDAYSRPAPLPETQLLWWNVLTEFSLQSVRAALGQYVATEKKFPPTPAEIRELLGAGKGDSRPGVDEAWAIALSSRDEAETVVWTPEIAEAFSACRPVLDLGDEVGARMAFKDAYSRIVQAARLRNEPVQWVASIGFDADRRERVLRKAESEGLLPAPQVAALLPPPDEPMSQEQADIARENTRKLKAMLAGAMASRHERHQARTEAERAKLAAMKADAAAKVHAHEESHDLHPLH